MRQFIGFVIGTIALAILGVALGFSFSRETPVERAERLLDNMSKINYASIGELATTLTHSTGEDCLTVIRAPKDKRYSKVTPGTYTVGQRESGVWLKLEACENKKVTCYTDLNGDNMVDTVAEDGKSRPVTKKDQVKWEQAWKSLEPN